VCDCICVLDHKAYEIFIYVNLHIMNSLGLLGIIIILILST